MKNILLTIIIFLVSINSITAQEPEKALVEKTLSYYLDGGTNNDFETLKKAFHETATMKFISDEGYKEVNALKTFKKGMKPGPKQNRKTSILSVDVTGNAATAKLKAQYDNFAFIDYMNLLKIDGEWKIVSKIYSRQSVQ